MFNPNATGESSLTKWDPRLINRFSDKSMSEETRRAYRRVVREFFAFVDQRHPLQVTAEDVIRWREHLRGKRRKAATISFKLAVVRSFFEYLRAAGLVSINPASTKLVAPPEVSNEGAGRALTSKEVSHLLAGPDRRTPEGARDYAILLLMLRTSLRVSEACSLRSSSVKWSHGRWIIKFKVKGGRERTLPLPADVKKAIDDYVKMDQNRRALLLSDGADAYIFQPHTNYRTLMFDKPLSTRMVWYIVARWAEYGGIGRLSPHDLRRTAITRALDQGLSYRQVQMMSGHKDPKTVMRYDQGRENLDLNAVNFLKYEEA
ncbi:MAG: tyrosine-type recombinase/integrase [Blastocatellia bacterium]